MSAVAQFCRDRQSVCHGGKAIPQIGLIYSGEAYYRGCRRLFGHADGDLDPLKGVLRMLLAGQNCVEVLMEHHVTGRMGEYPLLIVTEWGFLPRNFKAELVEYAAAGGNLLLIGAKTARLFEDVLPVDFIGAPEERSIWIEHEGWLAGSRVVSQEVDLQSGSIARGRLYYENDNVGPSYPAGSVATYGKGKVAAIYADLGRGFYTARRR